MTTTVIKGAAGSGKTEMALKRIAESDKKPYEIYVPTHKLADECKERLSLLNPAKRVVVIHGRDFTPEGLPPLCKKHKLAGELSNAGFPVFPLLCHQTAGKNKPPIKCQYYDSCSYILQFESSADAYIYPHAYLPLERSMLEKREPCGVVVDESFLMNLVEIVEFQLTRLTHPDIPQEAKQLCNDLADAIANNPGAIRGVIDNADLAGVLRTAQKALRLTSSGIKPNMAERQLKQRLKRVTTFKPVLTLIEHLLRSRNCRHAPQSIEFDHASGKVTIYHRKKMSRFTTQHRFGPPKPIPPTIVLDASADPLLVNKFFPDSKLLTLPLERNAHVIQCASTRCSTTSLVAAKNGDKKSKAAARSKIRDIQALIDRLATDGKRVLVAGPTAVVGNVKANKKALLKCPQGSELARFNSLRGIDRWKGFDTVLIIGRNQPSVKAVEDIARAIFFDDPVHLLLTGEWDEEKRGYTFKSGEVGVSVQVHRDPRVQAVVEQIREHESLQAIDRLRLIHNDIPKQVILLSNLPLDITVDELRSWDEVIYGSRLEQAWDRLDGVLPLNAAWLSSKFPDLWKTVEAAKKDVTRALKRGQTPNKYIIRKMSLLAYEYKPAHQRSWSRCLSRFDDLGRVEGGLAEMVGADVAVRAIKGAS